jgi:poly(3-hydroxybutyrate) depolymerase
MKLWVLFSTLMFASCANAKNKGASSGGVSPSQGAVLSAGCKVSGKPTGELLRTGVAAGGKTGRRYSYFVPSNYDPSSPLPLIFDFHGIGGKIQEPPYLVTSMTVLQGDSTPGIFVFPQGLAPKEGQGSGWYGIASCNDFDLAFFDAIFTQLTNEYCIDLRKVFVGGFSFGATMSQTLACCRGDQLRAIAPQSGGGCLTPPCVNKCPTTKWPAARYSYGTGDTNTKGGDGSFTLEQLRGSVEQTRTALHCSNELTKVPVRCDSGSPSCNCIQYTGCDESKPVIRCEYPGTGGDMHMYSQPDHAANVWRFYSSFR